MATSSPNFAPAANVPSAKNSVKAPFASMTSPLDVVMATPALRALRLHFAQARLLHLYDERVALTES